MSILEEFNSGCNLYTGDKIIELFHGSKGGIHGTISPFSSRELCDFGQGFYLGNKTTQAKSLVCTHQTPIFYTANLNTAGLKILELNGIAWALTVACCRNAIQKNRYPNIYGKINDLISQTDIVVGLIADDEMFQAMRMFCNGFISDSTLMQCLCLIDLGKQHTLKTERACKALKLSRPMKLEKNETDKLIEIKKRQRKKSEELSQKIIEENYGQGRPIKQIVIPLEAELQQEQSFHQQSPCMG